MDIFIPIMFFGSLLLAPILILYGVWVLVKKIKNQGWRSLVPLLYIRGAGTDFGLPPGTRPCLA